MTMGFGPNAMPPSVTDDILACGPAADCMLPMGQTSENVASKFGVTREKQDAFAALSHDRAIAAWNAGHFDAEIVPVHTTVIDKEGTEHKLTITKDDGMRPGTTAESLSKLKPAFTKAGTTTAGNASQVSDGYFHRSSFLFTKISAAAVLLMKRKTAQSLNLPILGRFVAAAVCGVPPNVMGIGPAFAIPKLLAKCGLQISDVDIFEINEAFASQAVYSVETLGIDAKKVNPKVCVRLSI
jgi:acetyl-CoA acyltransferase 1